MRAHDARGLIRVVYKRFVDGRRTRVACDDQATGATVTSMGDDRSAFGSLGGKKREKDGGKRRLDGAPNGY
jgi:hypothetical protein